MRLIALDLDGTLLDDAGRISSSDAARSPRFAARGGLVVLASGRMTDNIRPFYGVLGLDGPTIAYNGAWVRDTAARGRPTILQLSLPAAYADVLLDYTLAEHFQLNYYYEETLYARDDPSLRPYADFYARQTGAVFHFLPDLERFRGCTPTKLLIVTDPSVPGEHDPRRRDELFAVWDARWGQKVTMERTGNSNARAQTSDARRGREVTVERTNPEYLEFFHRDAGKGNALAALAAHYGIAREEVMALGDSFNDISMLEWAGCGIAVANAKPAVKAAADWVSPLTNNESAVADAIAHWAGD